MSKKTTPKQTNFPTEEGVGVKTADEVIGGVDANKPVEPQPVNKVVLPDDFDFKASLKEDQEAAEAEQRRKKSKWPMYEAYRTKLLNELEEVNRLLGITTDYNVPKVKKAKPAGEGTGTRGKRGEVEEAIVKAITASQPNHIETTTIKNWIKENCPTVNINSVNTKLSSAKKALEMKRIVQDQDSKWYIKDIKKV